MRVEPPLILVRSRGTDCTLATCWTLHGTKYASAGHSWYQLGTPDSFMQRGGYGW